jgi:hypothetical protein
MYKRNQRPLPGRAVNKILDKNTESVCASGNIFSATKNRSHEPQVLTESWWHYLNS